MALADECYDVVWATPSENEHRRGFVLGVVDGLFGGRESMADPGSRVAVRHRDGTEVARIETDAQGAAALHAKITAELGFFSEEEFAPRWGIDRK